jgi:hypothetical protein
MEIERISILEKKALRGANIYRYWVERAGIHAGGKAVAIVNSNLEKTPFDLEQTIGELKDIRDDPFRQFPGLLVLFLNNLDPDSRLDVPPVFFPARTPLRPRNVPQRP